MLNNLIRGGAVATALLFAGPALAEPDTAVTEAFNAFLEEQFEAELQRSPIALMQ